ncbi:MAG TPA: radical SAM protein, partial [Deltaproteobacteria bacterium]|nr:radical SAM protein [Deltaproteobacteria bacterium]
RAFSTDRVAAEIEWGKRAGAREVTIVDPCFARRPGLMDLLEAVARTRTPSMRLSCELNAEDVTAPLVEALVRAGVAHVETGLQSTNPRALAFVGRSFSRPDFIRGAHLLRSAGIHVMVDVMVGLPGDTPEDVMRSVDFVLDNDLSDELSLYPVSVLPGTVLRRRAEALGIAYLSAPPYLVTRTRDMAQGDMARVFSWCEDATGRDLFPVELPRMGDPRPGGKGGYVQRIVLEGHTNPGGLCAPGRVGQALCIELRDAAWLESDTLRGRLEDLLQANPYTLVSWVVPEGLYIHGRTLGLVRSARGPASHPADREYMSAYTPLRSHQVFLEIATSRHEKTYTLIPVDGDLSRPLWSGLPDSAGPYEEDRLARRLEEILHARPRIRFHDLEGGEAWPAARFLVSTTVR